MERKNVYCWFFCLILLVDAVVPALSASAYTLDDSCIVIEYIAYSDDTSSVSGVVVDIYADGSDSPMKTCTTSAIAGLNILNTSFAFKAPLGTYKVVANGEWVHHNEKLVIVDDTVIMRDTVFVEAVQISVTLPVQIDQCTGETIDNVHCIISDARNIDNGAYSHGARVIDITRHLAYLDKHSPTSQIPMKNFYWTVCAEYYDTTTYLWRVEDTLPKFLDVVVTGNSLGMRHSLTGTHIQVLGEDGVGLDSAHVVNMSECSLRKVNSSRYLDGYTEPDGWLY